MRPPKQLTDRFEDIYAGTGLTMAFRGKALYADRYVRTRHYLIELYRDGWRDDESVILVDSQWKECRGRGGSKSLILLYWLAVPTVDVMCHFTQ